MSDEYNYDIVDQKVVSDQSDLPKYLLADTVEEAELVYKKFSSLLNTLAYNYSKATGISKSDLFGEALLGLAKAKCDWDPSRSDSFKTYAVFRIKDMLGEYSRKNFRSVIVPSYIKKSNAIVRKLKGICDKYNLNHLDVMSSGRFPGVLKARETVEATELLAKLRSASERAGVPYEKFILRVEYIPSDIELDDTLETKMDDQEAMDAAIIVDNLKMLMDKDELAICEGIMLDKSYKEIGAELNRSKAWVSTKMTKLREKLLKRLRAEDV